MKNPLTSLVRLLQAPPAQKPKTYPGKSGGTAPTDNFGKRNDDLVRYRHVYEQGGYISQGIDAYPLMMFSAGYRLEGPRAKEAEQLHDDLDFETVAWKLVVDALVVKIGMGEIQPGLDAKVFPIAKLDHRYPETFEEVKDDFGVLLGYKQTTGQKYGIKRVVDITPENMFRLDLGMPLISRAIDDIDRDTDIAAGTAISIKRHGYPRWHITVGATGDAPQQSLIDGIATQFENLKPQHEMATCPDVKIENLDNQGVQNAKLYNEWATQRVTAAIGVPEEMLGLGRGVLTGEIRQQEFYDRIGTLQKRFARQWNTQILDRWATETGGKKGDAKLVFNDVSPIDENLNAELIQKLTGYSLDPNLIVSPQWCRKRLGISEEEYQKDMEEQTKIDAEQAKLTTPPALLPFAGAPGQQPPKPNPFQKEPAQAPSTQPPGGKQ